MPTTYRCAACDARWKADQKPVECLRCGSRMIDRADDRNLLIDDPYEAPQAALLLNTRVSSVAYSITYWGGFAFLFGGYVFLALMLSESENPDDFNPIAIVPALIGMVLIMVAFILGLIKIYQAWELIQPLKQLDPMEQGMPSPGLAIGLLFVPFYNLYWNFVAMHGLTTRANKYLILARIKGRPMNEGLAKILCIFTVCSIIPCVGVLLGLANLVIYYMFVLDIDRFRNSVIPAETDLLFED